MHQQQRPHDYIVHNNNYASKAQGRLAIDTSVGLLPLPGGGITGPFQTHSPMVWPQQQQQQQQGIYVDSHGTVFYPQPASPLSSPPSNSYGWLSNVDASGPGSGSWSASHATSSSTLPIPIGSSSLPSALHMHLQHQLPNSPSHSHSPPPSPMYSTYRQQQLISLQSSYAYAKQAAGGAMIVGQAGIGKGPSGFGNYDNYSPQMPQHHHHLQHHPHHLQQHYQQHSPLDSSPLHASPPAGGFFVLPEHGEQLPLNLLPLSQNKKKTTPTPAPGPDTTLDATQEDGANPTPTPTPNPNTNQLVGARLAALLHPKAV